MNAALDEIRYAKEVGTGLTGLSTGFTDLDLLTQGFKPQELIVLAARPAMGKTAMALSIMHHVAEKQKKHVYFISLEMGEGQIGTRYLALETGVTIHRMRSGGVDARDEKLLQQAVDRQGDTGCFHFDESPALTAQQICSRARKEHAKYAADGGLGMIVIDYIGLVTEAGRSNDLKADRIGEITRSFKQLARELKIPVIALAQLNRGVEKRQDKRPMMSDLRDSGSIEQDADVIMFLYRDEVYNPESIDKGIAEIILVKQRNGSIGTVRSAFDGPRAQFKDIGAPSIAHPRTMTMADF
jgi:replicative DNA helicase